MNVETERNADIAVNGIRGVVDFLTAPVTNADQWTTSLKIARGCRDRMQIRVGDRVLPLLEVDHLEIWAMLVVVREDLEMI